MLAPEKVEAAALKGAGMDAETADDIYKLTSLAKFNERFCDSSLHIGNRQWKCLNLQEIQGAALGLALKNNR